MNGARLSALTLTLTFTRRKYFWYSFLLEAESTQGHSAAGRIMSMNNSNDTIGNRSRDLPVCSAVHQPIAPPRAPTSSLLGPNVPLSTLSPTSLSLPYKNLMYRVIHKSMKHFKNFQQIDYGTDNGNSYADRERNSLKFVYIISQILNMSIFGRAHSVRDR
jgi:hypothetical protein